MEREARRLADQYWRRLTKCGKSYFLYSDDRLFEFRDSPRFSFHGEAVRPKSLSRADVLNGVDPSPIEWDGATDVSFELCRMNTSHSELPGSYSYGRTLWDGWGNWTSQHCEFGTRISRAKGKWTIATLKQISCDDLASWGFIAKPRAPKPTESADYVATHTRSDTNPALAWYVVLQLGKKPGPLSPVLNQTMTVISKRLQLAGVAEFKVEREPRSSDGIVVKLPPIAGPERLKQLISTEGRLEIVHLLSVSSQSGIPQAYSTKEDATESLRETVPANHRVLEYVLSEATGEGVIEQHKHWVVARLPDVIGSNKWRECQVFSMESAKDANVACLLNEVGAETLSRWTRANINQLAGLVLDDKVVAQYFIQYEFPAGLQFRLTKDAAEDLAITSKSGPLPVPVNIDTSGTLKSFRRN